MRTSTTLLVAALLLLVVVAHSSGVRAQSQQAPLELGYGLSSLASITAGVPVYTVGDTMWVLSGYSSTVVAGLRPPNASSPQHFVALQAGIPMPLHRFTASDQDGTWTLVVSGATQNLSIPVRFVNPDSHTVSLAESRYSLQAGNLSTTFTVRSADAYDEEACLAGNQSTDQIGIQLPPSVGAGQLRISFRGDNLTLNAGRTTGAPFVFWFELYHPYSYNILNTNEFVSREVRAAESSPVLVTPGGTSNSTLTTELPLRTGRFEVRAFFQTQKGLSVSQSPILVPASGSWLSLESCQLEEVNSTTFYYQTSLQGNPNSWPRTLYFMYRTYGVEATASLPLSPNISKVAFVAVPWNASLGYSQIRMAPNPGVLQHSTANGSVYLLTKGYPLEVTFSLGSLFSTAVTLDIPRGYSVQQATMSAGKLVVHVLNQETPSAGTPVGVAENTTAGRQGQIGVTGHTNVSGYADFFLPAGDYTVTVELGNITRSATAAIADGNETLVNVDFSTGTTTIQSPTLVEEILMVTAIIGVGANLLVWLIRPRAAR